MEQYIYEFRTIAANLFINISSWWGLEEFCSDTHLVSMDMLRDTSKNV